MWIKTFNKVIEAEASEHTLNNSAVVIDGHNFFYNLYEKSGLQFVFGCESDKYADFLRKYLNKFKLANVKCYFIFKGSTENLPKRLNKTKYIDAMDFKEGKEDIDIVLPIFMKEVYKQVLDEMDLDYVVCEFEAKQECVAFAQKHKCPIMSYDIEFCFSGVPYIPYNSLNFVENSNKLKCTLFELKKFLRRHKLTEEKLALFIVLRDQNIFPEHTSVKGQSYIRNDYFADLIKSLRIPLRYYECNQGLLNWLSETSRVQALKTIFKYNMSDKKKILEEETKVKSFICKQETTGVSTEYLENGNTIEILEKDAQWFEKGVALKFIAISYVDVYRFKLVVGSWAIEDKKADDSMLLSMQIIKYAYDLMTGFKHPEVTLYNKKNKTHTPISVSIKKPTYEADNCVFENGWNGIRSLKLFEHFLIETLQGFNFEILKKLPEDVQLLMISLVYFSRKKPVDTSKEVYSVLLSYIALSIVFERNDSNNIRADLTKKPVLDSSTDKNTISQNDKVTAAAILEEYFGAVSNQEAKAIFDAKLIHPLVEFQHILRNFNFLNKLCGSPYTSTEYSKTYNGTFVYKVLYEINRDYGGNGLDFVMEKLNPSATVLAFMNGLIESYHEQCSGKISTRAKPRIKA